MEEEGRVIKIEGKLAQVEIEKKSTCRACGLCSMRGKNTMIAEVENTIGAKVGERVRIEIPSSIVLKGALLFYTLPLVALILGMVLGITITDRLGFEKASQPAGLILGLILLVLSFILIWRHGKRVKDKSTYRSKIIQIIEGER